MNNQPRPPEYDNASQQIQRYPNNPVHSFDLSRVSTHEDSPPRLVRTLEVPHSEDNTYFNSALAEWLDGHADDQPLSPLQAILQPSHDTHVSCSVTPEEDQKIASHGSPNYWTVQGGFESLVDTDFDLNYDGTHDSNPRVPISTGQDVSQPSRQPSLSASNHSGRWDQSSNLPSQSRSTPITSSSTCLSMNQVGESHISLASFSSNAPGPTRQMIGFAPPEITFKCPQCQRSFASQGHLTSVPML